MDHLDLWSKCVAFHGHECGGLMVGFKAALLAIEELKLDFSEDEQVVCVSENDACGVDAIQVLLGCTAGKGNLLFHLTGKQAYSFYKRASGKSLRLVLRKRPPDIPRELGFEWLRDRAPRDLFDIKPVRADLPEESRIFQSVECSKCHEHAAEHFIRLQEGNPVCLDCWSTYNRLAV